MGTSKLEKKERRRCKTKKKRKEDKIQPVSGMGSISCDLPAGYWTRRASVWRTNSCKAEGRGSGAWGSSRTRRAPTACCSIITTQHEDSSARSARILMERKGKWRSWAIKSCSTEIGTTTNSAQMQSNHQERKDQRRNRQSLLNGERWQTNKKNAEEQNRNKHTTG